jgi:Protein of unknown function (DUF642)
MSNFKQILATLVLGFSAVTSAHANLVNNGDFELPVVPGGGFTIVTSIPGWTGSPNIEVQNNAAGSPFSGNNLVELDTTANSAMFQDILTTIGQMYTITFAYSARPGVAASSNGIDFSWNGAVIQNLAASGIGLSNTAWTVYTYNLLATGTTSRIGFAATGTSDSLGGYLDNVTANATVAAIPEPGTVSLLGAGMLLAALGSRRRRQTR